ncbi:methyl-accepting chemotaxis protein [Kineothrix sp. MB12-C1]|uniref:methyl-accepting chemotaxis protein n=1 Tax=Kineothrix sp. MB12-C1 TaxID=3070215 RepID=UPI0027D2436F|nr:methyl-accepting chemotaxis protein [Kineothrix sp. MB12-C1]WMC93044.1 methyl-accepting chemotaxis protein [Kineothrix sp. MB12-C1]
MEETNKKGAWLRLLVMIMIPEVIFALVMVFFLFKVEAQGMSAGTAALVLVLLLLGIGAGIFAVIEVILKNLGKMARNFDQIADGTILLDGNKLTKRNDELGQMMRSVNEMMQSFAKVVVGIRNAVDSLDSLSGDFKESFGNMTTALEQVSREVESIADNTVSQANQTKSIEEEIIDISHAIEVIASNIEALTGSADKMKDYNRSSEEIMQELVTISEENSVSIENVRNQTNLTNQSAQEIRQATDIIAGIASQTNLLALNASIEAARAGEQGKGFAVVAEEIRTLADQSRESSEHISKIVNLLISNSDESVEVTQKVSDAFVLQNEKIRRTKEIFAHLNHEIMSVGASIDEISTEVNALDQHKDLMKEGIVELSDAAISNTTSARETTDAMLEFEGLVSDCKQATEQITSVTKDLIENVEKIGMTAERRRAMLDKYKR